MRRPRDRCYIVGVRTKTRLNWWTCGRRLKRWLIGSIRRECLDHFIVWGETHLRRILRTYARYYNDIRTHWSLDKDAPAFRPIQRTGIINSPAILGGLHHYYIWV